MKLKAVSKRTQGTCSAVKCKAQATDLLCPEHEQAWRAAGAPALVAPASGTELAPVVMQTSLAEERHTAQECLQLITTVPLDTDQDRERMTGFIRQAKDLAATLETRRTAVTGPLNTALRELNSWFKPVRELYESIERAGKDRLKQGLLQAESAQDRALAVIQAAGGRGSVETLALAHATPALPQGVSSRDVYTYTVTDPAMVPDKYWILDHAALGRDVRAQGMECDIPGIRVERDVTLSVRSDKS